MVLTTLTGRHLVVEVVHPEVLQSMKSDPKCHHVCEAEGYTVYWYPDGHLYASRQNEDER